MNNSGMPSYRHSHESAVSAISLVIVALLIFSMVLLSRRPDLAVAHTVVAGKTSHPPYGSRDAALSPRDERRAEIRARFQEAVMMLHAKKYAYALTALHRVLALSPRMPEAYVNMGYALLGLKRYRLANQFFRTAIELRPYQGNAYWGLAVALDNLNDLQGALGAMRTYIHLAPPGDPYVRRARSALWEWEDILKHGPRPNVEEQWLTRKGREWEERNSPRRDSPETADTSIPVRPLD